MSDPDLKQVKVDNWGIFFLQRLKHFFNRTDYCDLTLQFQDNAQLKVHRLVLNACTEYFEVLERTCEMYEDCLVMPDDLQADVVVPIVNFMYTGQLEFRMDLLERLYQTSQIMNMPVLTKLLDAHRNQIPPPKSILNFNSSVKRSYTKNANLSKPFTAAASSSSSSSKRTFHKAFGSTVVPNKKLTKLDVINNGPTPFPTLSSTPPPAKVILGEPRPTRYEVPEELDADNIFEDSFTNISYGCQPLMVHPETTKRYVKKSSLFSGAGTSKIIGGSTMDIVECKKIRSDHLFEEDSSEANHYTEDLFQVNPKNQAPKVSNLLFDQIREPQDSPKFSIESKDGKQASKIDHAKIISEVLKKYPQIIKSNKNIKLKILSTPTKTPMKANKRAQNSPTPYYKEKSIKTEVPEISEYTYETDVLDSKEAARLIALGADNIRGPWICLICGTPGKALHFASYYTFRRHLVEVHNEKPVANICEYCGQKSNKRNYMLHHMLTKHGVEPPPLFKFPKCNMCDYIGLTEGYLVKHKLTHAENRNFRCNVCSASFFTSRDLLVHIQKTGHKYSADRTKANLQCIYCLKTFMRESNLYAHLKINHKSTAKADGIIEDSDEEKQEVKPVVKYEPSSFDDSEGVDVQYKISPDGNLQIISNSKSKKQQSIQISPIKQKILNTSYTQKTTNKAKPAKIPSSIREDFHEDTTVDIPVDNNQTEEIIMIDNNEYVMKDNKLVHRKKSDQYATITDLMPPEEDQNLTTSSEIEYTSVHEADAIENTIQDQSMVIKKSNINQPIQIVVSSEEEYKALMNSNHSIIFDDGDANKTLTVLTAPQHATISTGSIDLDNTQQNEMMIISDNYPLNVSEARPTDNSNIVVVYSHPVNEQSKQFQIITSQDIGAQFVQTSAVITPNYDGINTSAPIMSAHVINAPVAEAWQTNMQQNQQLHMTADNELQEMTIVQDTEMAPAEIEASSAISELPEVTLTPNVPVVSEIQESNIQDDLNQDVNMNNEVESHIDEQVIPEEQNLATTPTNDNVVTEGVIESTTISEKTDELDTSNTILEQKASETEVSEAELIQSATIVDDGVEIPVEHAMIVNEDTENLNDTVPMEVNTTDNIEKENNNSEEQSIVVNRTPSLNEEVIPSVAKEQIQSLTSEWSEDEDDPEQEPQVDEGKADVASNGAEETGEIEESIENIQQEMEKQMTSAEPDNHVNITSEENVSTSHEEQGPAVLVNAPVQEKISSLLNDWDENDSQEESGSQEENGSANDVEDEEVSAPVEVVAENPSEPVVEETNNCETPKDDKIKSLVSDWDDEEDQTENEPKEQD